MYLCDFFSVAYIFEKSFKLKKEHFEIDNSKTQAWLLV